MKTRENREKKKEQIRVSKRGGMIKKEDEIYKLNELKGNMKKKNEYYLLTNLCCIINHWQPENCNKM